MIQTSQKYELIYETQQKYSLKNLISHLCDSLNVSKSGYYRYFSETARIVRQRRLEKEEERLADIRQAIDFKGRKRKGIRQVKMVLVHTFNKRYNQKSIHRIMRKYGLLSPVRRPNPYKRIMKATQEHRVHQNHVNRQFKRETPGQILLTDITYLKYRNRHLYLSTILDSSTNEIVAYKVSDNLKIDFVLETLDVLTLHPHIEITETTVIHSDQGAHYTSPKFSKKVKELKMKQSMSRKGNCWDNAPQESFFGHLKDELMIRDEMTREELLREIDDYIYYYNHHRYQQSLKEMTPVQYRDHLLSA